MKTTKNNNSVKDFIDASNNPKDSKVILKMMKVVTGKKAYMWGPSLIGFDSYTYHRKGSKEEFEFLRIGFSPRVNGLSLYMMPGYGDFSAILKNIGPHKLGKGCIYFKNLDEIDLKVLEKLIKEGYRRSLKEC